MKAQKRRRGLRSIFIIYISFICLLLTSVSLAKWLHTDPPPDVDKYAHGHNGTSTCWLATASNILAGAGYGTGTTVQARADSIYTQMVNHYGKGAGWTDAAVEWWLSSSNNIWKGTNEYTDVEVYGNKSGTCWLKDSKDGTIVGSDSGAMFIGNRLRDSNLVGISITFTGGGGHAITGWGDDMDANTLVANPNDVIVTDSDYDLTGDTQQYTYKFTGGCWRFYKNQANNFIKHIIVLSPCNPTSVPTKKVIHSFTAYNRNELGDPATGINYDITSDVNILCYNVDVNWPSANPINVYDNDPNPADPNYLPTAIYVDYPLDSNNFVPINSSYTATNKLTLQYDPNSGNPQPKVTQSSYTFTYTSFPPYDTEDYPPFEYGISSNLLDNQLQADVNDPNITGGFIVGTFDIYDSDQPNEPNKLQEFRFCWEYNYFLDPQEHIFELLPAQITEPLQRNFWIGNFKFGHSYGLLIGEKLWSFDQWQMQEPALTEYHESMDPIVHNILLPDTLPYPRGENFIQPQTPENCGDVGAEYKTADINLDCYVDFKDLALMATDWLTCTDPNNILCD